MFYVYILRTDRGTLYIGQTNNLKKRLAEHQGHTGRSAKYTRSFKSCTLVYKEEYSTRSEAMKREWQLKQWPKQQKEALIKAPYTFRGKVRGGAKRGRDLGFPTANLAVHRQIPEGVYVSTVTIEGKRYPAATFVGSAKTFGETAYKAESYILDFSRDIYGTWITVSLVKKIRGNKKFSGASALIAAINSDVAKVRKYFR